MAVRKGGVLSVMGVYGVIDKFPFGVLTNKGITMRTSQQPGQRYMGACSTACKPASSTPRFLVTHRMSLEASPRGYEMFKQEDGCPARGVHAMSYRGASECSEVSPSGESRSVARMPVSLPGRPSP
jgi:hypothetical protein